MKKHLFYLLHALGAIMPLQAMQVIDRFDIYRERAAMARTTWAVTPGMGRCRIPDDHKVSYETDVGALVPRRSSFYGLLAGSKLDESAYKAYLEKKHL